MTPLLLFAIICGASFTQGLAGFGLGLIAVPLMVGPLGVPATTSIISALAFLTRIIMMFRYHRDMDLRLVWRMMLASALALPLGVLVLQRLNSPLVLTILGVVIFTYALYALLDLHVPQVVHSSWAFGAGFLSGLLSGAYNVGGPPIVIYGTSRRWTPDEFRSNIQGVGLMNTLLVILLHLAAQDYTPAVWTDFAIGLPAMLLGVLGGMLAAPYVNAFWFRRVVLVLLLFIGLSLIF